MGFRGKQKEMRKDRLYPNILTDYEESDILTEPKIKLLREGLGEPVVQEDLDRASGARDLSQLAAALSGSVSAVGSYDGKTPDVSKFQQLYSDMGNSEMTDVNNRMSLQRSQEDEIYDALQKRGIADQAKAKEAKRAQKLSPSDRAIVNAQLKKLYPEIPEIPEELTYGELEDQPVLSQALGMGAGGRGMTFDDRMALLQAQLGFRGEESEKDRTLKDKIEGMEGDIKMKELDLKGKTLQQQLDIINKKLSSTEGIVDKKIKSQENLARMRAGTAKAQKDDAAAQKVEKETRDKAIVYTKRANDGKFPQTWNAVREIEGILKRFPEGDVPGIGIAGRAKRATIMGFPVGDWAATDDDRSMAAAFQKLKNLNLKELSGAAVTASEMQRFETAYASGNANQFRVAFKSLQKDLEENTRNLVSGFDNNVLDFVKSNNGIDFRQYLGSAPTREGGSEQGVSAPTKRRVFVP